METKERKRPASQKTKVAVKKNPPVKKAKRPAAAAATKRPPRRTAAPPKPSPDVVYTQPDPFNRARFILYLASVVAVVLALLFGMSIFFKVERVTVAGNNKYTVQDIKDASGLQLGENLLTISHAKLSSSIQSKLPYVDSVRIGIKLPDTVKIEIKELDVVYAAEAEDGSWWLIRADGVVVEQTNNADAEHNTQIKGITLTAPVVGEKAVAAEVPAETTESGESIPVTVLASEQLNAVISILQYLEQNGIIGDITTVDVTDLSNIEMQYGERFQIRLGDTTELFDKIEDVKQAIDEMESYASGILDASRTVQPDPEKEYQVIYTPING